MKKEVDQIILCLEALKDKDFDWVRKYGKTYLQVASDGINELIKEIQ